MLRLYWMKEASALATKKHSKSFLWHLIFYGVVSRLDSLILPKLQSSLSEVWRYTTRHESPSQTKWVYDWVNMFRHMLSDGTTLIADASIFHYDVFVSYCNEDRDWVLDHLLPHLESDCSISACLHERDFQVFCYIIAKAKTKSSRQENYSIECLRVTLAKLPFFLEKQNVWDDILLTSQLRPHVFKTLWSCELLTCRRFSV